MNKFVMSVIGIGVLAVVLLIVFFSFCGIAHVEGHELAIVEKWSGVVTEGGLDGSGVRKNGKYIFFRPTTDIIKYDMRRHHYKMVDEAASRGDDPADGPAYVFEVQGGQKVKVGWDIVWRYDQVKLQQLHQDVRNDIGQAETKILANPCKLIAQNLVTDKSALEVYYGKGLKDLQLSFKEALLNEGGIADAGIIIESAVVMTQLEKEYTDQIKAKVVAEQKEIAQAQVEKANRAEAAAAKAAAEIDKNKRVIAAEASKAEQILAAEAKKDQAILAAQAEKEKRTLEAQGKRDAMLAEAEGVKALKLAEAEGEDALKKAMYDGEAGLRRSNVEIADKLATKLHGILAGSKVIPEGAFVALMNETDGVKPVLDVKAVNK